ncbi:uncharacterized protein LOC131151639 [Malania oleifera]|uniref:uncharacterized protein LOC131151639 n=1 Tax=Malania oleifera TaxID=397392 RepID=UPI0025ADF583|nr:uncharacterized protein LOC131151639 [Malania oleifera]
MNIPSTTSDDTRIVVHFSGIPTHRTIHLDHRDQSTTPLLPSPKPSVSDDFRSLQPSLKWCALDHSSPAAKIISYVVFLFFALLIPAAASLSVGVPATAPSGDPTSFNKLVQLPESTLAAIAFLTLSRFFERNHNGDISAVRGGYTKELDKAFQYLGCILLPSFVVQVVHKVAVFSAVTVNFFPGKWVVFGLVLGSWVYRTGVFLLVCVVFRLRCEAELQRLEGLGRKLREGAAVAVAEVFEEHKRIREELGETSHGYRFFIIGCLVTMTVSQLGALLLVLASKSHKNFFNSGDLVICSVVQLSGFFLCLMGAARITHRAQGIVSVAAKWHLHIICAAAASKPPAPICGGDSRSHSPETFITTALSSEDPSSFQARQALVTYLQHNNGGITLFGFALDRGLLHTLFAFEFSLVLWILSKVIVLHS